MLEWYLKIGQSCFLPQPSKFNKYGHISIRFYSLSLKYGDTGTQGHRDNELVYYPSWSNISESDTSSFDGVLQTSKLQMY